MKNFLIALVLAVILINCLGSIADSFLGMHIVMSDHFMEPWESLTALSVVGVVIAIVGFVVAISVIGTLLLTVGIAFVALFAVGISAFWPIILFAVVIYALRGRNRQQSHL